MKKISTLLLALVTLTSVFAQSGHDGWNGSQNRNNRMGSSQSGTYSQPAYSGANTSVYTGQNVNNRYNNNQVNEHTHAYINNDTRNHEVGWDREHMQRIPEYYNPYAANYERNRIVYRHKYDRDYNHHYDERSNW